jgi:hypothetical protein
MLLRLAGVKRQWKTLGPVGQRRRYPTHGHKYPKFGGVKLNKLLSLLCKIPYEKFVAYSLLVTCVCQGTNHLYGSR